MPSSAMAYVLTVQINYIRILLIFKAKYNKESPDMRDRQGPEAPEANGSLNIDYFWGIAPLY